MALDIPMSKAAEKARLPIEPDTRHVEILVHMLGAGSHVKRGQHGYRNHFCAGLGSDDHLTLQAMASCRLVRPGRIINDGRDQYFYATEAGCDYIGLSKAAKARALREAT